LRTSDAGSRDEALVELVKWKEEFMDDEVDGCCSAVRQDKEVSECKDC
jgi:hypothetical protein